VLELVEEAFDEVAQAVDFVGDRALLLAIALGRDVRLRAVLLDEVEDGFGVVATIGNGIAGRLEAVEQSWNGGLVGGLAGGQDEPER